MSNVRLTQRSTETTLTYDVSGAPRMSSNGRRVMSPKKLSITWRGEEWDAVVTGTVVHKEGARSNPVGMTMTSDTYIFSSEIETYPHPEWLTRAINESRPALDDTCCCCGTCEWGDGSNE